jgi:hypothetical protein
MQERACMAWHLALHAIRQQQQQQQQQRADSAEVH